MEDGDSAGSKRIELRSIRIMRAEDLPESVKEKSEIKEGFVEVRTKSQSRPRPQIMRLTESPLQRMRDAFKKEGLTTW